MRHENSFKKTNGTYFLCLLAVICFSFLLSSCKKQNKESKAISKDYIVKGSCGENIQFKLYKNGTLKIYGEGAMIMNLTEKFKRVQLLGQNTKTE